MAVQIGSTAGYLRLDSWRMAKIIQLVTFSFCRRFLNRNNDPDGKQFGQTTGAARAVPANIAEGSARHQTSNETELRLLDVARASLSEVLDDMMFFLMANGEKAWPNDDPRAIAVKGLRLEKPNYDNSLLHDVTVHINQQRAIFAPYTENADMAVCANAIIILCQRVISMLRSQMGNRLDHFEQHGGFTENMTDSRLQARRKQSEQQNAPRCPKCGAVMVKRMAKKGINAGHEFWSCSAWRETGCTGTRPITD